jgi:hypothetical protein
MGLLRRLACLFGLSSALSCLNTASAPSWPILDRHPSALAALVAQPASDDVAFLRQLPVCVASRSWSAGELGQTVLYHYKREGRTLRVGYFVYWSTERPWGDNVLSYTVLPAFLIDAFYSHLFFVFPGAQRWIHGPGDIEGVRVLFEQQADGTWAAVSAVADDGTHDEVPLSPDDFIDDQGRVVLMTDVWSHQLGATGAGRIPQPQMGNVSCFAGDALLPMSEQVAADFRLGSPSDPRRAPPAWQLDGPFPQAGLAESRPKPVFHRTKAPFAALSP